MDKVEFETSIQAAIDAKAKAGTKWRALEETFGKEKLRGSGALNNDPAERKTRIRQLVTSRKHPGFDTTAHSQHGVLVLAKESARKVQKDPDYLDRVVQDLKDERVPGSLETALVIRASSGKKIEPVALIEWGSSRQSATYQTWYPSIKIIREQSSALPAPVPAGAGELDQRDGKGGVKGENLVYFGPPGTGKSFRAAEQTEEFAAVLRTVFHPEYSYAEFIGSYKPVTGADPAQQITAYDGKTSIDRPVVYYAFEPGVLIKAIGKAVENKGEPVALIIEEINRGDCAAIFGDFLQLLDRDDLGRSQYGIRVSPSLGKALVALEISEATDSELFLPENLFIIATMNTSDQALYPMDSAFKRRWSWVAVPINHGAALLKDVSIAPTQDRPPVMWLGLVDKVNSAVVAAGLPGDKRIGPWYVKTEAGQVPSNQIRNKLLFYLWHDVFRDQAHLCFSSAAKTFDELQEIFDRSGLREALKPIFAESGP